MVILDLALCPHAGSKRRHFVFKSISQLRVPLINRCFYFRAPSCDFHLRVSHVFIHALRWSSHFPCLLLPNEALEQGDHALLARHVTSHRLQRSCLVLIEYLIHFLEYEMSCPVLNGLIYQALSEHRKYFIRSSLILYNHCFA